jgi:Rieske Fe-S protein
MQRRQFLTTCALIGGMAGLSSPLAADGAAAPPRWYTRSRLVDIHGRPIRVADLAAETNYVFQYPFVATPCLLLRLPKAVAAASALKRENGASYDGPGGIGAERDVVSFSAICAHKLAYPTREVSFIRYQRESSATASARVIHCCADHSVYDPAQGARVVAGPAPQPLAAIVLEYDAAQDGVTALGTVGPEQFDPFFDKYRAKLTLEYGPERARTPVAETTVLRELTNYCRTTISC